MPRPLRITELNPTPAPEVIPGYSSKVRFANSGRTVATFQTMALTRRIPITAGEVVIVDEGRPDAAGSNLILAAPPKRGVYETGNDGAFLEIISTCNFKHVIRTPAKVLNGCLDRIDLHYIGAAVRLYAWNGLWLVVSASPYAMIGTTE